MNLPLFISRTYQKAKKNQLVELINKFSTLGIVLGVMVLIIGLSAMNGFERELNNRILAIVPHVEISPYPISDSIQDYSQVQKLMSSNSDIVASAPFVNLQGLMENGNRLKVIQIRGVLPAEQEKVSALHKFVENNGWNNFKTHGGLIVGAGIAKDLDLKVGDYVTLMLPQKFSPQEKLNASQQVRLPITGILRLHGQLDHTYTLMPLHEAQKLMGYSNSEASGIELKVQNPFAVQNLNYSTLNHYPQALVGQSWITKFGFMYRDIQLIRSIMYLAMVLVIAVACFNIISTLMMTIKDKQNDIAILRTMGANRATIGKIFINYGLLTGIKGSVIGIILGLIISLNLTNIIKAIEKIFSRPLLSGDIYFIDFLPSQINPLDIGLVLGCTIILSLMASLYPAYRASRIPPAKVLMNKS